MKVADGLLFSFQTLYRYKHLQEQRTRLNRQSSLLTKMAAGALEDFASSVQDDYVDVKPSEEPLDAAKTVKEEDSERSRSIDESSHKNRSKRERGRMRELEQAQFSLELLKVRTTSMGGSHPEDLATNSSTCQMDDDLRHSQRGSPESHGSFEMLSMEEMETDGSGGFGFQSIESQEPAQTLSVLTDSNHNEKPLTELPNKVEEARATFYIPSDQSPIHKPKLESPGKPYRDRKESSSLRPVVVLISMKKESPVDEGELLAARTLEAASQIGGTSSQTTSIGGLEIASYRAQPVQAKRDVLRMNKSSKLPTSSLHGQSPESPGLSSSKEEAKNILQPKTSVPTVLPSQREMKKTRPTQEVPNQVLDTKPPKAPKKSSAQTVTVNMVEKSPSTVFSAPRRKLPFSK